MLASEWLLNHVGHKYVYNITAIDNIPSIIQNGILSHHAAANIPHSSIAMAEVQARRSKVRIPGGGPLHDYANLYFDYNNPMLFLRKGQAEELCILGVDASVMDQPGCIISDRNAATSVARFYAAPEGISKIDIDTVFLQYWTHEDPYEYQNRKAIKCAEILVPGKVPYEFIVGAYVVSDNAAQMLKNKGFGKLICVRPKLFYR